MSGKKRVYKQQDITDCGAACLASISSHYGYQIPISKIRQYASTDKKGTNVLGMIEAAEKLGFSAKGVKGPFESLFEIPKPAIAHIIVKKTLYHYVVIYEVTKKHVVVMDPGQGEVRKILHKDFIDEWTGVLILMLPSDEFEKGNETTSALSRFWNLIKPHKTIMTEALIGAIVTTILGLSTAIYVQKIVDYVLVDRNANLLNLMSIIMVIILLLNVFVGTMSTMFTLRTGQKIDVRLILGYYKHLLTLPQKFFDTMRIGEIISRLNDAVKIRAFINETAIEVVINILTLIFSVCLMVIYSWKIALLMLGVFPLYLIIYFLVNKINKKFQRKIMENAAELESQLVESLNSVKTIKQFGLEWHANIKTETRFVKLLGSIYKSGVNSIFAGKSAFFVSSLFTIMLLWLGSTLVLKQALTPGELMSCYALVAYFTGPLGSLIGINKVVQDAMIASDRLFEIMDLEHEMTSGNIELTRDAITNISFNNISFRYGSRTDVFKNLNLVIKTGVSTGIVGESGSGKTTLAALIQKIYPVNDGIIKIADNDINEYTTESLRNIISIVPQHIDIFAGSIIDNIAVGDFEPDMQKINEICNLLGIKEFIENLPHGYQTFLGENGANLSGGERQRIAIARALYKDPEVLILDEATSSLDSGSEQYVQKAIKLLIEKKKTVIIIAHRLSTIKNADDIIVFSKGDVVERGSHNELYSNKKTYYKLWKNQFPMEEVTD